MAEQGIEIIFEGGSKLKCYDDGKIFRWFPASKIWKEINNVANTSEGYNAIGIEGQIIKRHRLICFAFRDFDFVNSNLQIDHIDHNRMNNSIDNLRVVTNQQNCFNRSTTKGFTWDKNANKFKAYIKLNGKKIHLGYYDDEEDAKQAYLEAKAIHHVFD